MHRCLAAELAKGRDSNSSQLLEVGSQPRTAYRSVFLYLSTNNPSFLLRGRNVFLFLCALLVHAVLHGQAAYRLLNQSNGLSELRNSYISSDSKGFVWIGSFDGLNRFDGKSVKIYRPNLPDGSYAPNITSKVMESDDGRRWFSTSAALHYILPESDRVYALILQRPPNDSIFNTEHTLIHVDSERKLWVVANSWLHLYDLDSGKDSLLHPLNTFSCYPLLDVNGKVTGLLNLLVTEGGGVEIITYKAGKTVRKRTLVGAGLQPKALALFSHIEADTLAWLPSNVGLVRLPLQAPERTEVFRFGSIDKSQRFTDVCAWDAHRLIVGTAQNGWLVFDKRRQKNQFSIPQLTQVDGGASQPLFINKVFVDKQNMLWVSVWDIGVFYTSLRQEKFQGGENHLTEKSVAAIAEDNLGDVWTGSEISGLVKYTTSGQNEHPFLGINPHGLLCDIAGDLWAFNSSTVYLKRKNASRFTKVATQLNRLYKIVQSSNNDFLFICPNGIYRFHKSWSLTNFTNVKPLLTGENLFSAFQDSIGNMFVSDELDKLWVYGASTQNLYLKKEISGVGYTCGMVQDQGLRWFASNKGLLKLNLADFTIQFVKGKGNVLLNSFNAIQQDLHGNLWLSSNAGLYRYNPNSGEVKHYTESDGLQGMQFLLGSACKLSDGRLAFGGVNGLNIFHPDSIRDNPNPPLVHFTDWIVNDTGSISTGPEYLPRQSFPYDKRTLSFHFVGIDYTAPEEVRYKYRLAGFETDTVEGGTNGFARYAQLPSGDYTFQVWAANSDGVWTSLPHELHFTILPPWYATWWARSLQILLIITLLYGFYRNRIAQVRRKEAQRRKEAEFRQKEAEGKQLAAELQNSVLRLQMNPHFIFNSMNSISSYILQKDIDTANDYLGRFAKLMRLILDLAAKRFIPIADEIELLEQYMAAEAMRFENKFTWLVEVDDALDSEEVMLPTMILQPFVENAIWHGFSTKKTAGFIHIQFKKQPKSLLCIVRDNGVGRVESQRKRAVSHTSSAVMLTEQRLSLLEKKGGFEASLEIIDLYDNDGAPTGTSVEIRLPLDL